MNETGATTTEFAVGTVGAAGIAAVLIYLGQDSWFGELIKDAIRQALDPTLLLKRVPSLPWSPPWTPVGVTP